MDHEGNKTNNHSFPPSMLFFSGPFPLPPLFSNPMSSHSFALPSPSPPPRSLLSFLIHVCFFPTLPFPSFLLPHFLIPSFPLFSSCSLFLYLPFSSYPLSLHFFLFLPSSLSLPSPSLLLYHPFLSLSRIFPISSHPLPSSP